MSWLAGYKQIIDRAHGIRFAAVTLTPFIGTFKGTPLSGYYTPENEKNYLAVNAWIRANKTADVIDFDKVIEAPANPSSRSASLSLRRPPAPERCRISGNAKAVDLNVLVGK